VQQHLFIKNQDCYLFHMSDVSVFHGYSVFNTFSVICSALLLGHPLCTQDNQTATLEDSTLESALSDDSDQKNANPIGKLMHIVGDDVPPSLV
jgi:hypothetical protein